MPEGFEWDPEKEQDNRRKHGVGFDEARTVFEDPGALIKPDPVHSLGEERYIILGRSSRDRLLVVVHTDRGDLVRIISARPATPRERRAYEEGS